MLLRLVPRPTPSNPSPLTILFTLPLPTHPYTSRSLPLPAALLSHRNLCLQESFDCHNVLLGECASWIVGVIDDVTFSLPLLTTAVNFIDGSSVTMPITEECVKSLEKVIEEVQLSFAAAAAPQTPVASPRVSTSSTCSSGSNTTGSSSGSSPFEKTSRRTSSLFLSFISPLMPSAPEVPSLPPRPSPQALSTGNARVHRRQARSILVDTYRRHVLPIVKKELPSAYLPWSIRSESIKLLSQFEQLKGAVDKILAKSEIDPSELRHTRCRSPSTSSIDEDDVSFLSSDIESSVSPITPANSVFSFSCLTSLESRPLLTTQAYLLSRPASSALPTCYRGAYTGYLARLAGVASRLSQIRKLGSRYEREEGRRRWLDSLERGRLADRAVRRAWSNMELPSEIRTNFTSMPSRRSALWKSWTAGDIEREEQEREATCALEDTPYASCDDDSDCASDTSEEALPVTPTSRPNFDDFPIVRSSITDHYDASSSLAIKVPEDECVEESLQIRRLSAQGRVKCSPTRPPLSSASPWEESPVVGRLTSAIGSLLLAGPLLKAKLAMPDDDMEDDIQIEGFHGQCGLHV